MAVRVLTLALTATPCRNGVALHITAPSCQPVSTTRQLYHFTATITSLDKATLTKLAIVLFLTKRWVVGGRNFLKYFLQANWHKE